MPPVPKKKPVLPWVLVVALLALAGGGYLYARDRSDEQKAKNKKELEQATARVTQTVTEAVGRAPDVDNTSGAAPKAMRIRGGDSGTSFTVYVPPGWEGRLVGKKVVNSAIEAFINGAPSDGFAPNVVVEVTTAKVGRATLDQLLTQALNSSAQQLEALRPVGAAHDVDVGDENGRARDYSANLPNGRLSAQLAVAVHDGRAYFFYLSTLPAQRDEAQNHFDELLDTVEFE
jgi:hypothetical protein